MLSKTVCTTQLESGSRPKIAELKTLQMLRAIAAISVVYFHTFAKPTFGLFGVDIFFVLSGFVMAMVIANGQTPRSFIIGRISRIIPLYWIITTCLLVLAIVKPDLLGATSANLANYLKSIFFIPYFKENGTLVPMLIVGWTLNYEMFFYLCIWISISLSRKYYALLVTILVMAAHFGLGKGIKNPESHQFFGQELILEFLFGIAAFIVYQKGYLKNIPKVPVIATAVAAYVFMAVTESNRLNYDRLLQFGIPSVLLVFSVVRLEGSVGSLNNWLTRALLMAGNASYATYLTHLYVVEGTKRILLNKWHLIDPSTPWGVLFVLVIALLLGQSVYEFVDKPLSAGLRKRLSVGRPAGKVEILRA